MGRSRLFTKDQTSRRTTFDLGISGYTQLASSGRAINACRVFLILRTLDLFLRVQSNGLRAPIPPTFRSALMPLMSASKLTRRCEETSVIPVMANLKDGAFGLFGGSEES